MRLVTAAGALVALCAMVCAQEPATGAVEDAVQPQKAVDAIKQWVGPAEATAAVTRPPIDAKQALRDLRIRKCRAIVRALYPRSGFGPHVEHFIDEHERMGIGDEWQWSLAYGGSNFSLRVGGRAPGRCYGPMDVKGPVPTAWRPTHLYTGAWSDSRLLDPRINISVHVAEAAYHHRRTGRTGYRLMQAVFLPGAPRDWGTNRDRIRNAYGRHVRAIEAAYKRGDLP